MAYDEYSSAQLAGERLDPDADRDVKAEIRNWVNADDAIAFLRAAQTFRKTDLVDSLGWDETYARAQIRYLQSKRLLKPTRLGFYKSPAFIALLRVMANDVEQDGLLDVADAPF